MSKNKYVSGHSIRKILSLQIFQCGNLRVLCLNGNFLHSLSPSIGRLKKLEVLLLSDNCLQAGSLPHTLSFCRSLRTLHLDNNLIITLPGFLLRMTNLRTLRRLSTKITVRDILRKTTARRSIECFR